MSWRSAQHVYKNMSNAPYQPGVPTHNLLRHRLPRLPEHPWTRRSRARRVDAKLDTERVFSVYGLTVETAGTRRLDGVSFELTANKMLAVLGGSGAGKSTLLKAMTGSDPATSGTVLFEGRDLYRDFTHLRHRIGYVPQDDILHAALSVRATLRYASMLRMPDASPSERHLRIAEVLDELGLTHRVDAKVTELSGGQRKRLNVALELLARPPLLILDEPTSGLDPANERSLMQLLRALADGGRTVIVVTHSTESLHLCDEVLFLARGGRPVYLGPPEAMAPAFGMSSVIDAFAFIDEHQDPAALRTRFDTSRPQIAAPLALPAIPEPAAQPWPARLASTSGPVGRDVWILLRRGLDILRSDRRNAMIVAAQGPAIAVLMFAVFGSGKLASAGRISTGSSSVLLALVLAVVFVGAAGSVREIVKERPILLREQAVGVSTAGYVAAKVVLQGAIVLGQAALITFFTLSRQEMRDRGLTLVGSATEISLVVMLAGLGAVAVGLLISAAVTSADKAMTLLPVALFVQLLLAGVIVPVTTIGIQQLSWFVNAQWGLDGVAAVSDLWTLRGCALPGPDGSAPSCSDLWKHSVLNLGISLATLSVLFCGAVWGTYRLLARRDPAVVLTRRSMPR